MEDRPSPPLPSDVATLQGMVRELLATVADLRKTVATQQHRIDDLTRRLYGKKSERVPAGGAGTGVGRCPTTCPASGSRSTWPRPKGRARAAAGRGSGSAPRRASS